MSSSATAEPDGAGLAERSSPPRRTPAILLVAGVLAVLLVLGGVLLLLEGNGTSSPPPRPAIWGVRLQRFHFPPMQLVGEKGTLAPDWWSPHGAVLLFFANWCSQCHGEVPTLAKALGRGDVSGVRVIGFDADASTSVAAGFVRADHVHFPVAHDGNLFVAGTLVPVGLPAAIFVKPSGKVVGVDYGPLSIMQLDAGLSMIGKPKDA